MVLLSTFYYTHILFFSKRIRNLTRPLAFPPELRA